MTIRELRERRAKLLADLRQLHNAAEDADRAMTPEERERYRGMETEYHTLGERLEREQELAAEERAAREVPASQRETPPASTDAPTITREQAFESYLRHGMQELSPEARAVLASTRQGVSAEMRTMSGLSGASGGFLVAPDTSFFVSIMEAARAWGGMFEAGCQELTTGTGADLPIPTTDDTSNKAVIVGESASHASGTDPTFGNFTARAHMYTTKIIKVPVQLLQDSSVNIPALLARMFGVRLGRGQNEHLTVGTGAGQPQGVVTGSTQGYQSATGFTTSVATDDLIQLQHAVNRAYRKQGKWMFADTTALKYRLLKDGEGRYIWQDALSGDQPSTLLGKPVIINDDVAAMAASAKHTLFGDFGNYLIRRVSGVIVVRSDQIYMETAEVAFCAFQRLDGLLLDAGTHPIQHLANSAS